MNRVGWIILYAAAVTACSNEPPPPVAAPVPAVEPATETILRDVTADAGLQFEHFVGAVGEYYFVEIMGAGAALVDYDLDGDLDVYLVQGAMAGPHKEADSLFPPPSAHWPGNRLFRNELLPTGRLTFVDVTEQAGVGDTGYGMGVAVGDVDADGDPDMYVTNFGANVFYRNDGDGTFTAVRNAAGAVDDRWSTSASFVDYDNDGDLDLYVASYVSFSIGYNKRCTNSGGERDYCAPQSFDPLTDRLFRNDGDWQFTDVSVASGIANVLGTGLGVSVADFNGDGWADIYVANDQLANMLWINQGDGTFTDTALMAGAAYNTHGAAEASMGVSAGDFDGDGDEDLFMTHLAQQTNTLYANDGHGVFLDVTDRVNVGGASMPFTGFGTGWFDYDNDGFVDLFVANGAVVRIKSQVGQSDYPYAQTNQLFRNDGGKRFSDISRQAGAAFQVEEVSRGTAFGDIDNDGDIDVLVTNNNGPARLLRNEVGQREHWLSVRLRGTQSNRDGVGARVAVLRQGRPVQWRRAHTDGSYLSASDVRVHFGLGDVEVIEGVVVEWPGGLREVWGDVGVDQWVELVEGSGAPMGEGAPQR